MDPMLLILAALAFMGGTSKGGGEKHKPLGQTARDIYGDLQRTAGGALGIPPGVVDVLGKPDREVVAAIGNYAGHVIGNRITF